MTDNPRIARLVLFAALAVAVAFLGFSLAGRQGGLASVVPGHCTMGLAGAAVSVTYDGAGAGAQCDRWNTTVTDGGSWYRYQGDTQPAGAVICQEPADGTTATVRDQGAMNLYGTQVCKYLAGQP
jgi:hypothetical protein